VQRLSIYADHYRISGDNQAVTTKTLILAGGARLIPRLRDLGLNLPLKEKMLTSYIAEKIDADEGILPNYFDRENLEYGRFSAGRNDYISNPKTQRILGQRWSEPMKSISANDCYAPHRLGFSGKIPGLPRLYLATGWGGTGFKFALEIGNRVANAVEADQPERRIAYA
jgi:glycine/D-amino acid oxidase-like deaminating enzyme